MEVQTKVKEIVGKHDETIDFKVHHPQEELFVTTYHV